jgi:hypothetical protein
MDPIRSIDWSRQALLSDGDPLNSGVVRNDTPWWEERDGGSFCMAP